MSRHDKSNHSQGLTVQVRNNDINGALRKFKKKVNDAGIIQEVREREYYEKPTTRRKKAKAAAKSRWKKQQAKLNPINDRKY